MKKLLTATLAAIAVLAFASSPAFACGAGCPPGAKSASAKVGQTEAKLTSADGQTCPYATAKVCAAKLGISEEECRALCESGKLTVVNMSVKGMTCGNCENSVTASLEKVPGVIAVASVDYKTGTASVFSTPAKVKPMPS